MFVAHLLPRTPPTPPSNFHTDTGTSRNPAQSLTTPTSIKSAPLQEMSREFTSPVMRRYTSGPINIPSPPGSIQSCNSFTTLYNPSEASLASSPFVKSMAFSGSVELDVDLEDHDRPNEEAGMDDEDKWSLSTTRSVTSSVHLWSDEGEILAESVAAKAGVPPATQIQSTDGLTPQQQSLLTPSNNMFLSWLPSPHSALSASSKNSSPNTSMDTPKSQLVFPSSALLIEDHVTPGSRFRRRKSMDFTDSLLLSQSTNTSTASSRSTSKPPGTPKPSLSGHTLPHESSSSAAHLVPSHRKQQHAKSKILGASDLRSGRMRNFFRHGILRHDERVFQNRGLVLPPAEFGGTGSGGKWNLGNLLHITDKYCVDLDVDLDQGVPGSPMGVIAVKRGGEVRVRTLQVALGGEAFDRALFESAQVLVREQFAKKNVNADLDSVLDDDFSLDVVIDAATGQVIGAVEYVFMKRFLWIDAIAVREDARGFGVGDVMLQRLKDFAVVRGKQLLCFALHDVVGFYERHGFARTHQFPEFPWHIGKFLAWNPVTRQQ
ncbi:hypothetical protein BC830DRAFT_237898 [Chytriomyces sp. MP71]|nr:hypothetical protein BC830DRAFT_237898 [Chytriomyces sp. MP71]